MSALVQGSFAPCAASQRLRETSLSGSNVRIAPASRAQVGLFCTDKQSSAWDHQPLIFGQWISASSCLFAGHPQGCELQSSSRQAVVVPRYPEGARLLGRVPARRLWVSSFLAGRSIVCSWGQCSQLPLFADLTLSGLAAMESSSAGMSRAHQLNRQSLMHQSVGCSCI